MKPTNESPAGDGRGTARAAVKLQTRPHFSRNLSPSQHCEFLQQLAERAKQRGDRDAYWRLRVAFLNVQAELYTADKGGAR